MRNRLHMQPSVAMVNAGIGTLFSYPGGAAGLASAVGYGTWTAAWNMDESSGNLQPAFGSPALSPDGSPTYGVEGPLGGDDKAVTYAANSHSGGDVHDVGADDDLCLLAVARLNGAGATAQLIISKGSSGAHWRVYTVADGTALRILLHDGVTQVVSNSAGNPTAGVWYTIIGAYSRGVGIRVAARSMDGSSVLTPADLVPASLLSTGNVSSFAIGGAGSQWSVAYAAIGVGGGAATNLPANIATACQNFNRSIGGA